MINNMESEIKYQENEVISLKKLSEIDFFKAGRDKRNNKIAKQHNACIRRKEMRKMKIFNKRKSNMSDIDKKTTSDVLNHYLDLANTLMNDVVKKKESGQNISKDLDDINESIRIIHHVVAIFKEINY